MPDGEADPRPDFRLHPGPKVACVTSSRWNPTTYEDAHLPSDPGERFNVAAEQPDVVADLPKAAEQFRAGPVPGKRQY